MYIIENYLFNEGKAHLFRGLTPAGVYTLGTSGKTSGSDYTSVKKDDGEEILEV